jgi:hypothetical protein
VECEKPFSVTVGAVLERSHIPLHLWVCAAHLLTASKEGGISTHQLMRMLGLSYKPAWFLSHRIREAMKANAAGCMAARAPARKRRKGLSAVSERIGNTEGGRRQRRRSGSA